MSDAEKRVEKQDAVLAEFTRGLFLWEGAGERQRRMADEIVRLRAILAALREPSEVVAEEAASKMHDASEPDDDCRIAWEDCIPWYHITRRKMATAAIRGAVAAAEQEVGHE